jgi:hypothetical protein
MKKKDHHRLIILFLILSGITTGKLWAQDTAVQPPTIMNLRYFLPANKIPYLMVSTKKKVNRKFVPVPNIVVKVYLGKEEETDLLGRIITAANGEGRVALPANFKDAWDSLTELKFIASSVPPKGEEALAADITIKKAILVIDTLNEDGSRSVTGQLKEKIGSEWLAVKDVEMKLGIKRMLSSLSVGDAETYTADSTGIAIAVFKRDSIPGDEKGNIILVAAVEDNDSYGNLMVERPVQWGRKVKSDTNFWHRTLWSTGNRAPIWLLAIAFSILIAVWGVLLYLVKQLFNIKKMARQPIPTV